MLLLHHLRRALIAVKPSNMNKLSTITLNLKRFVLSVALLLTSISLVAQPEQTDQEKAFAQRLYEAQMGSESEYYTVHKFLWTILSSATIGRNTTARG